MASGAGAEQQALLMCDLLAQRLSSEGAILVVDRTQLQRVIRERPIDTQPKPPALSYDAMVRLEVTGGDKPQLVLRLIDLSLGNELATHRLNWPPPPDDVAELAEACRRGLAALPSAQGGRMKIRLVGAPVVVQPRMRPLVERLSKTVEQSLASVENVVLVHHLDAGSAAEDSLLLLMGFSRLGGQRQFLPEADATVELRIAEEDAIGKSFEETGILLGARIRKGKSQTGEWMETRGRVGKFDELVADVVRKSLEALGVPPGKAGAADMALRRKQAEAELRAISHGGEGLDRAETQSRNLAHIEAAIKLDPTYREAYSELLSCLGQPERLKKEAIQYVDRFGKAATKRDVCVFHGLANGILVREGLSETPRPKAKPLSPLDADFAKASRKLVEMQLARGPKEFSEEILLCVCLGYYSLVADGVPAERRREWVQPVLAQMDAHEEMIVSKTAEWVPFWTIDHYGAFRLKMARWAAIDGDKEWAAQLIRDAIARMRAAPPDVETPVMKQLLAAAVEMGISVGGGAVAASSMSAHDVVTTAPVTMLQIALPRVAAASPEAPQVQARQLAEVSGPVSPLLASGDRLFIVRRRVGGAIDWGDFEGGSASGAQEVGILKVVADLSAAEEISILPQVQTKKRLHFHAACLLGETLVLATRETGIMVADLKTRRTKAYGPEQGLPVPRVDSLVPMGDGTVLAVGQTEGGSAQKCHFIFDPRDGKSVLLRRGNGMEGQDCPPRIILAWRDQKKLRAWLGFGYTTFACEDLLDPSAEFRPLANQILSAAAIGERLFLLDAEGLAEANREGRVIRRWPGPTPVALPGLSAKLAWPLESPIHAPRFIACGQVLIFSDDDAGPGYIPAMVAYDTATDTWYGPLRGGAASYAIGNREYVWFGTEKGMLAVSIAEMLKTARESGRMWTTPQWQAALGKLVSEAPALEQAKIAFIRRQFGPARRLANKALDAEPGKPEALLLMGWLHQQQGEHAQAAEWYDKLVRRQDASASFTGAVMLVETLAARKKHREAVELIEKTQKRFPKMPESNAHLFGQMAGQFRQIIPAEPSP